MKNIYLTTDYNLQLLKKYTKDKQKGLCLIPSPTGSGKTHAIINYIIENINIDKKFIYTIPVKTNLEDFKIKLLTRLDEKYHQKILSLRSLTDELKHWYFNTDSYCDLIFYNWKEFTRVLALLNSYETLKQNSSLDLFDNNDFHRAGNNLIFMIKKQYNEYMKKQEFNSANKLEKDTIRLFKSFDIENYSIILTSTSKFSHPIKTIKNSKYIWDLKSFENAIIFLDEFDSQKKYFLTSIIKNSLYTHIDLIELFRLMTDTFKNMSYENKFNYQNDDYLIIKNKFIEIYDKRKLKFVIDTKLILNEFDNLPILINSSFSSINLQNNNKKLFIKIDEINEQLEVSEDEDKTSYLLSDLFKEISQIINRYIIFSKSHIYNELERFKISSEKPQLNQENFINAKIHDNIKIFGLSVSDIKYKYLLSHIKNGIFSKKKFQKSLGKKKWNFYQNGFSLVNISKTYVDSNITDIEYFNLYTTPEALIIEASQKCMLIGVSATANINTVIRNFDIDYLKSETKFNEPTIYEINKMQELFLDSKKQRNRNFNIQIINNNFENDHKIIEFCKRNFSSDMAIYTYLTSSSINENTMNYYMNFIDLYKAFLEEEKIQSMLYFSSRYIRHTISEDIFNYKFLYHLLISLIENMKAKTKYIKFLKRNVKKYILNKDIEGLIKSNLLFFQYHKDTEDFYDNYISECLSKNRKIFIYANYHKIGTGKNLEYSSNELEKKDFDAIFLEKPTNLIQRKVTSQEEKLLGIFQIESLFRNYILSIKEYKSKLYSLMNNCISPGVYSKTNDNIEASMQIIIQAIGRLHRTNSTTDMFIFIDYNLIDTINSFENINIPSLPSFLKIKDFSINYKEKINLSQSNVFENKLNELTRDFSRMIKYSLEVFKEPTNINSFNELKEIWNNIREFVLKYPSISLDEKNYPNQYQEINNICHIEVANIEYTVYQTNDFNQIHLNKVSNSHKIEISENAANLHLIKQSPELKEFALNNNITLEFKHTNLMTPIVFNNIYKGALGEKIGKYIIEKYCNIKLNELSGNIEEKYESFDYKNDEVGIYFDFKYYSSNVLEHSRNEVIVKAKNKLKINKLKKALIINIFAESQESAAVVPNDDVIFIPYLVNTHVINHSYIDINIIESIKGILYAK